ncbi:tigger transposable element-derived protein 6-like [Vanessa cardui]|uniref:tigger transposable element-derived protein 6-like n=1 Tax=Vanessa cardui TaxID=171605 RepID=UPI001F1350A7|nr:tigger transposable element-derived protein 6-like [Vanessa cardui]
METMGITIGPQAEQLARNRDERRVWSANRRSTDNSKEARTVRKNERSDEIEEYKRSEGILYDSSEAHSSSDDKPEIEETQAHSSSDVHPEIEDTQIDDSEISEEYGPLLKEKSKEFATKLGTQNLSASNGWLEGFKRRHDIAFKKAAGESKSVDQGVCNQWTEDLPNLLEGYEPDDIYNADETALFFKCLPDKTFTFKGEKCHGGKQSKERLTLLQCVNMSGTDKLPLLIIGKSKRPRCFKGVKTLPVDYANNTKTWMTKILFKDWLKKVDKQMKINRKKILLFIDNCAAHTDLPTLANVKVMFLPANTTSKLQSLDQGIIHTFKRFYRREVVKHILTSLEENSSPDINVLLAMKFARKAWYLVSDVTVKNYFKKAGFWKSTDEQGLQEENDAEIGPSNEEWTKLVSHGSNMLMPSFDDFVQIDDDVTTTGELTDDDIVKNCVNTCIAGNDSEDETQIPETEIKIIPMKLALQALETVH